MGEFMKTVFFSALATFGLATAPIAASAEETPVSYDDAMKCSALFSLLAAAAEGTETAEFADMSARWLVVAIARDGTEDGSKAEAELEPMLDELINALEEFSEDEEAVGEQFLLKGIEFCEGKHQTIAEEIDGIEFE